MTIGERLRERRNAIGLSLGQVEEYEGLTAQYLSDLERGRNQPNVWPLIARLAKRYRTTTDYLLGLTEDPSPRREEPIPPTMREVLSLGEHWSAARQDELLAHARVLDEAQRADNLVSYDQVLATFRRLAGPDSVTDLEELLRADAAGDTATARRLFDGLFARFAATQDRSQELPQ